MVARSHEGEAAVQKKIDALFCYFQTIAPLRANHLFVGRSRVCREKFSQDIDQDKALLTWAPFF